MLEGKEAILYIDDGNNNLHYWRSSAENREGYSVASEEVFTVPDIPVVFSGVENPLPD